MLKTILMKTYAYILCFAFICNACNSNKETNRKFPTEIAKYEKTNTLKTAISIPTTIEIDLSDVTVGNLGNDFKFIRALQIDNKEPIGEISKIDQFEEKIFIADTRNAQKLFCYNLKGELQWIFDKQGDGPLEYNKIADFVVNKSKKTIDVLDENAYKIIQVDIDTGKPINSFKIGVYANELELYKNKYLFYTFNLSVDSSLNYKLLLSDVNTKKVVSRNLPLYGEDYKKLWKGFRPVSKNRNGKIFFTETLNDTIYSIKNDTVSAEYYIDFLDKKFPNSLKNNFSQSRLLETRKKKPFISPIDFVREKYGVLNFSFSYNGKIYTAFLDTKTKQIKIFRDLKNSILSYKRPQQIHIQGYLEEGFIKVIDPIILQHLKKRLQKDKKLKAHIASKSAYLLELIENSNDYTNPILLIYEYNYKME